MESTVALLILLYSPQSQYFVGPVVIEQPGQHTCLEEARAAIGKPLETTIYWEKEMMGPLPHVYAAYCVLGNIAKPTN